jgi:acyl-CoA synthetase (AMP-forming)/AMP-acid ligase II
MAIVRSPHADVEVPDVALTEFVLARAVELGARPALVDGPSGRTLTYAQLAGAVKQAAGGLAARGFGKGDVLAIYSPNLPEYAVAFHAAATLGGVTTTVNPLYTAGELAAQLGDSGAKLLITVPPFLESAREASRGSEIQEILVFGEAEGATPFAALLGTETSVPDIEIEPSNDLVAMPYSSGTTGLPKGVMLTHRNLVANLCQFEAVHRVGADETTIAVLPFFHIYGLVVIMNAAVSRGATVVTMPRFELDQFLQTMQDHRVTRAYVVPPIALALAKHPAVDNYDLSALKIVFCGAAPLGPELSEACAARLGCMVLQGYGMTETSPVTHVIPEDPGANKPGSIGPPIPLTECRVVDLETGDDAAAGELGEIWIRGPQVMQGYLNNPRATADTIDDEGWLHTGDIGYADEDGYFFIVDRLKELIKYKGFQVAPAELEAVLVTHPAIGDAAVIPSPDEEAGEIPKAFVVPKADVTADEIMAFVAERVAPHKKVRLVEMVEEIPKSPSGKILRRVLIDRERTGTSEPVRG